MNDKYKYDYSVRKETERMEKINTNNHNHNNKKKDSKKKHKKDKERKSATAAATPIPIPAKQFYISQNQDVQNILEAIQSFDFHHYFLALCHIPMMKLLLSSLHHFSQTPKR